MTFVPHDVEGCVEDNCFKCKMATFNIGGAALPTRRPSVAASIKDTKAAEADIGAYKRLRREGFQPKGVKGAAKAEAQAGSRFEVETGVRLHPELGRKVDEAQTFLKNGGMKPLERLEA